MRRTAVIVVTAVLGLSSTALANQPVSPRLVAAVSAWATQQSGHVTYVRPWPLNPRRDLVTVEFPIVFTPSDLVGSESMTVLVWRPWPGKVAMRPVGEGLTYPAGYQPVGSPHS